MVDEDLATMRNLGLKPEQFRDELEARLKQSGSGDLGTDEQLMGEAANCTKEEYSRYIV